MRPRPDDGAPDVDALMAEIHDHMEARRRRGELYADEAEQLVRPWLRSRAAAAAERHPDWMEAVGPWDLEPECELRSHRARVGGVLVALKRLLIRPLVKWLQDWVEANLLRQRRTNRVLLGLVRDLAVANGRLEARVRRLEAERRSSAQASFASDVEAETETEKVADGG